MIETEKPFYQKALSICPICKKKFAPAPLHAWRIRSIHGGELNACSYTCCRKFDKEQEEKQKAAKAARAAAAAARKKVKNG